jgi:hypothetical protein
MQERPPNFSRNMALVALAALAIRLAALSWYHDNLRGDPDHYRRIAAAVVAGQGYSDIDRPGTPTAYRPPLYPLVLAVIEWCAANNRQFVVGVAMLHAVLGALCCALVYAASARLTPGRASLIAGAITAADPLLVYSTTLVMTETTAAFLAALVLLLAAARPGWGRDLALGAAFGLACLCRPTFWAFGLLAAAPLVIRLLRGTWGPGAGSSRATALASAARIGLAAAMVTTPWVVRNTQVFGRPIVTTTHGGYTLLLAHNSDYAAHLEANGANKPWEGQSAWFKAVEARMTAEWPDRAGGPPQNLELDRDAWMQREAQRYILAEPRQSLRAGLSLWRRLWNLAPLESAERKTQFSRGLWWVIAAFNTVVFLALAAGLARSLPAAAADWWPTLALLLSFTTVHFFYWADLRMRAPLVPAIALFAAAAFCRRARMRR